MNVNGIMIDAIPFGIAGVKKLAWIAIAVLAAAIIILMIVMMNSNGGVG